MGERDLLHRCLRWAREKPDDVCMRWLRDDGTEEEVLTFARLASKNDAVSYHLLHKWGARAGDRALLVYSPGLPFVSAFLGCINARVVAVPVYPPDPRNARMGLMKMESHVRCAEPRLALTEKRFSVSVRAPLWLAFGSAVSKLARLSWFETDALNEESSVTMEMRSTVDDTDLAFIQFTSGSTGTPKGVMISHGCLCANMEQGRVSAWSVLNDISPPRLCGWVPQYHDLGLCGHILWSLYMGGECTMMSPIAFLKSPYVWLKAISKYKASHAAGPNFAFSLCVHRVRSELLDTLDLSSLRALLNGAEPVRADTIREFSAYFAQCGLRPEVMAPCYGMAETCIFASIDVIRAPTVLRVSQDSLTSGQKFQEAIKEGSGTIELVGCGRAISGAEFLSVSPESREALPESHIGELWLSSPGLSPGYYNDPEATADVFHCRLPGSEVDWYRTGDLGFLHNGEVFVCGRIKDVMIFCGKNHYPQDIEATVERADQRVRPGCVAAFSMQADDANQGELLVVAAESREKTLDSDAWLEIVTSVKQAIAMNHGLACFDVVLLPPRTIQKTTSGKIQRSKVRQAYMKNQLKPIEPQDRLQSTPSFQFSQWIQQIFSGGTTEKASANDKSTEQAACLARLQEATWVQSEVSQVADEKAVAHVNKGDFISSVHLNGDAELTYDAIVVGAGMLGLCFARDLASLGYDVLIVEKNSQIGGVWRANDYPGLRLHSPGFTYRCLSRAPQWTRDHLPSEFYRPTRDEILDYCQELVDHPGITLRLNTSCDHASHHVLEDHVRVPVGPDAFKAKFLYVSVGVSRVAAGEPIVPLSIPEQGAFSTNGPRCVHSSRLTSAVFKDIISDSARIVVVGSGKSALDILQNLSPGENVIWAHRGHTVFFRRDTIEAACNGELEDDLLEILSSISDECAHDESLATLKFSKWVHSCKGRLKTKAGKSSLGICSEIEVNHANRFKQLLLDSLELVEPEGILRVRGTYLPDERVSLKLGTGDAVIFCTGQRNADHAFASISSRYSRSGLFTLVGAPMNQIVALCSAVDLLRGKQRISEKASRLNQQKQKEFDLWTRHVLHHHGSDTSADALQMELVAVKLFREVAWMILDKAPRGDLGFMKEWSNEWHGRDVNVDDAMARLCSSWNRLPGPCTISRLEEGAINREVIVSDEPTNSAKIKAQGKLDAHREGRVSESQPSAPNTSEVTSSAVSILSEITGVDVQPSTTFVTLPLSSIQLITFCSRLNEQLELLPDAISPALLMDAPEEMTVADVAHRLVHACLEGPLAPAEEPSITPSPHSVSRARFGWTTVACLCGKTECASATPTPFMKVECACEDCRQALEWCALRGGPTPPRKPLEICYFLNDFSIVRGKEHLLFFRLRDNSKNVRSVATCCYTPLFYHPVDLPSTLGVLQEVCHLDPPAPEGLAVALRVAMHEYPKDYPAPPPSSTFSTSIQKIREDTDLFERFFAHGMARITHRQGQDFHQVAQETGMRTLGLKKGDRLSQCTSSKGAGSKSNFSRIPSTTHFRNVKLLVLHGEAADGELMQHIMKLTGWQALLQQHGVELLFLDAPHSVSPRPELYAGLVAEGKYGMKERYNGWGLSHSKELRSPAFEESLLHVERWISEHDNVCGICGISDGALVAAAASARTTSLSFFINFCSVPWERLPPSLKLEISDTISMPSLHVLGKFDQLLSKAQLRSVPSLCLDSTTVWHDGGHVVPLCSSDLVRATSKFLTHASQQLKQDIHLARPSASYDYNNYEKHIILQHSQDGQKLAMSLTKDAHLWFSQLNAAFEEQQKINWCALASLKIAFYALCNGDTPRPLTQMKLSEMRKESIFGYSMESVSELAEDVAKWLSLPLSVRTIAGKSPDDFFEHLEALLQQENTGNRCILINLKRKVQGVLSGHWSPVVGYVKCPEPYAYLLDVCGDKLRPHWVPLRLLARCACTFDSSAESRRGCVVLECTSKRIGDSSGEPSDGLKGTKCNQETLDKKMYERHQLSLKSNSMVTSGSNLVSLVISALHRVIGDDVSIQSSTEISTLAMTSTRFILFRSELCDSLGISNSRVPVNTLLQSQDKTVNDLVDSLGLSNAMSTWSTSMTSEVKLDTAQKRVWKFGYGSNMDINHLRDVKGVRVLDSRRAILRGFKLYFPEGSGLPLCEPAFAHIKQDPTSLVHGVAVLLDMADASKLDQWESTYNVEQCTVEVYDTAEPLKAELYLSKRQWDSNHPEGECSANYRNILVRGAEENQLDPKWIEQLRAQPTYLPSPVTLAKPSASMQNRILSLRRILMRVAVFRIYSQETLARRASLPHPSEQPSMTLSHLAKHDEANAHGLHFASACGYIFHIDASLTKMFGGQDVTMQSVSYLRGQSRESSKMLFPRMSKLTKEELDYALQYRDMFHHLCGEPISVLQEFWEAQDFSLPGVYDGNTMSRLPTSGDDCGQVTEPLATHNSDEQPQQRLLILHGEAADGDLMRKIMTISGWLEELSNSGIHTIFVDAPHSVKPVPELYAGLKAEGAYERPSYKGWGLSQISIPEEAFYESVVYIERLLQENAPVAGICGISDGGLAAAVVARRSASLQFFINFCSMPWERLPQEISMSLPDSICIPSLHFLGKGDELLRREQLLSIPSKCTDCCTIFWHESGHVVPALDPIIAEELAWFLNKYAGKQRTKKLPITPLGEMALHHAAKDSCSTVCRILSDLTGIQVHPSTVFQTLALQSIKVLQFRQKLCSELGLAAQNFPVRAILKAAANEASVEEMVNALINFAGIAMDAKPSTPAPAWLALQIDECNSAKLDAKNWFLACNCCALLFQPMLLLSKAVVVFLYVILIYTGQGKLITNMVLIPGIFLRDFVASFCITCFWILMKWLCVGRLKPTTALGSWPLLTRFRWRAGRIIQWALSPHLEFFRGTLLLNYIMRALGAKVHSNAVIETTDIFDWDLVELGPNSVLQEKSTISGVRLHGNDIQFHAVYINASVGPGAHVPAGTRVSSPVSPNACASSPENEQRNQATQQASSQAAPVQNVNVTQLYPLRTWFSARMCISVVSGFLNLLLVALLICTALAFGAKWPEDQLLDLRREEDVAQLRIAETICMCSVNMVLVLLVHPLAFVFLTTSLRMAFIPKRQDGDVAIPTVGDAFLEMCLRHPDFCHGAELLSQLDGFNMVLRALGMTISTDVSIVPMPLLDRPELVTVEGGVRSGGGVSLCTKHITDTGQRQHFEISIKKDSFIGTAAMMQPMSCLGPAGILGNLAVAPAGQVLAEGTFFGVPTLKLPVSSLVNSVNRMKPTTTFGADTAVNIMSFFVAALLDILFLVPSIAMVLCLVGIVVEPSTVPTSSWLILLALTPWLSVVWDVFLAISFKLCFVGSQLYEPDRTEKLRPLENKWRELFIRVIAINFTNSIESIRGTRILNVIMRLLGARIGANVVWLGFLPTEGDMLCVEDNVFSAPASKSQTHSRETGTILYEPVHIESNCLLDERAWLTGLTTMKASSVLCPMGCTIRGQTLEPAKVYSGNPAEEQI